MDLTELVECKVCNGTGTSRLTGLNCICCNGVGKITKSQAELKQKIAKDIMKRLLKIG